MYNKNESGQDTCFQKQKQPTRLAVYFKCATKNFGAFSWCFPLLHTIRTLGMVVTALAASSWIASDTSTKGSVTSQAGQHLQPTIRITSEICFNYAPAKEPHARKEKLPHVHLGFFCLDNPRASKCHQDKCTLAVLHAQPPHCDTETLETAAADALRRTKSLMWQSGFGAAPSEYMRYWSADRVQSSLHNKTASGYIQALHCQPT